MKLGIIGGAGPLASALLYESLIKEAYAQRKAIPEIILINFPFSRGLSLEEKEENKALIDSEISYCVDLLLKTGIKEAVIACNTLHLFLRELTFPVKFHHLPDMVQTAALKNNHRRLLILGTQNTCRSQLYRNEKIETINPSLRDQQKVDEIIDRILEGNILNNDSKLIEEIIKEASHSSSFDGVVLACSDLPVLHSHFPIQSKIQIYDSIKIPAQFLGDFI